MGEREAITARQAYYRARQRCVRCGTQDAFTLIGKRLCADCTEKAARYSSKYGKEHREKRTEYQREWARKRVEAGLCPRCGKPAENGYSRCARCRARDNAQRAKKRRENGVSPYYLRDGICYTCKRRPALDGKKLCRECYEKSVKSMAKAREAQKEMGANAWVELYANHSKTT